MLKIRNQSNFWGICNPLGHQIPLGLLSSAVLFSRSALAWAFFHICCSRAHFDQCCRALTPHLSTGQPNGRVAFIKFPSAQPSKTHKHSNPGHWVISASSTILNIFLPLCKNDAPTLLFSWETLLVFALWNSSSILKHFSLHNHPSVRGKK